MIISDAHRFVFLHNPKAGGTSVRAAIERFNDIGFGLWGADSAQTGGRPVDRAHLGLDEFAGYYPDLWARIRSYRMFCLYRDPVARFLSSVWEHSKLFGSEDLRFVPPARGRTIVLSMVDRLELLGQAEAVMDLPELTHFRPQYIYWTSAWPEVRVRTVATTAIGDLFAILSATIGADVALRHDKAAVRYRLPGPLGRLAAQRGLRTALRRLPGGRRLVDAAKRGFSQNLDRGLPLNAADRAAVEDFVRRFYASDYARWPTSTEV